jgi:hypothetical protein
MQIMKRFSIFALLLGLTSVLGCEPPKPAPKTEAPKAEMTPPADDAPAADAAPAGEKPADDADKK